MENAAEVLKMFFAVFVFSIALAVFFRMTSNEKDTADMVFTAIDKTTYIDYNSYEADGANRKVTFQEIMPTIYRYAQEGYGVTIIDNGKIVSRFDLDTESQVSSCLWTNERYANASETEKNKSDNIKEEIREYLNKYIVEKAKIQTITTIDSLIKDIYSTGDTTNPVYTSWLNSNTYQNNNIAQRVNCDMYGRSLYGNGVTSFSLRNPGTNETVREYTAGKHEAVCNGNGLFATYKDSKFTEYIVQIDRNKYTKDENGNETDLLSYGEIRYTKKREIIYVKD